MADKNELQIILSLVDEASGKLKAIAGEAEKSSNDIRNSFQKASEATVDFGHQVKSLGKTISSTGQTMAFFGAGISAPFILAIKNSAEHSTILKNKLDNIKNVFDELQMKIATAVIPIIDKFSNIISNLNNFLNSLPPELVNTILQVTFAVGIFLTFGGVLTAIIGKVIALVGNLGILLGSFGGFIAANIPLLIIAGSIALLVFLMFKFKVVADIVMNTFELLFLFLKNGFDTIIMVVNGAVAGILSSIQFVVDAMARIPGPTQAMFQGLSDNIQGVTNTLNSSVQSQIVDIQTNTNEITTILETGTGKWAQSFDKAKNKFREVMSEIKNFGAVTKTTGAVTTATWSSTSAGLQSSLGAMSSSLTAAAAHNKKFAMMAKVTAIGLAIVNTAVGITNALATPPPWFGLALAVIMAAAGAIQIATISSQPMAKGGIVTRPTNALIGEAGPEAVIPLNKFGGGFGNTQNVHIEIFNPVVRSDEDIDKLTEEISMRLAMEAERL